MSCRGSCPERESGRLHLCPAPSLQTGATETGSGRVVEVETDPQQNNRAFPQGLEYLVGDW
jgi:hypothetical protein